MCFLLRAMFLWRCDENGGRVGANVARGSCTGLEIRNLGARETASGNEWATYVFGCALSSSEKGNASRVLLPSSPALCNGLSEVNSLWPFSAPRSEFRVELAEDSPFRHVGVPRKMLATFAHKRLTSTSKDFRETLCMLVDLNGRRIKLTPT